jgi:hypothetical protein
MSSNEQGLPSPPVTIPVNSLLTTDEEPPTPTVDERPCTPTCDSLFRANFLSFFRQVPRTYQGTLSRNFRITVTADDDTEVSNKIRIIIKVQHKPGILPEDLSGLTLDEIQDVVDDEIIEIMTCIPPSENGVWRLVIIISIDDNNRYRIFRTKLCQDYFGPLPDERFARTRAALQRTHQRLAALRQQESLNPTFTSRLRRQTSVSDDSDESILTRN